MSVVLASSSSLPVFFSLIIYLAIGQQGGGEEDCESESESESNGSSSKKSLGMRGFSHGADFALLLLASTCFVGHSETKFFVLKQN